MIVSSPAPKHAETRLMDRKLIALELGVANATAENLMRQLPKVSIGRRVFVLREDVDTYLSKASRR